MQIFIIAGNLFDLMERANRRTWNTAIHYTTALSQDNIETNVFIEV